MKRLLTMVMLLLITVAVNAQNDPVDTTQIIVKTGVTNTTPALIHLPNDYSTSSTSYPLIIFCHGAGQQGGPASALYNNTQLSGGPAYFIGHGQWPSSFSNPIDGQSYKFIVVSPWYTSSAGPNTTSSITSGMLDTIIPDLLSRYRIDASRIYLTGLSAGGEAVVTYISNAKDADGTPIPTRYKIAASVPMSVVMNGSHEKLVADSVFAKKSGLWCFGSPSDTHGATTLDIVYYINQDSAGYAQQTSYTGGHCCWDNFYTPTFTQAWRGNTVNIYQFLLGYKSTQTNAVPPLIANAGSDQSIQLPLDSASLSGSASSGGVTSYAWSLISGPSSPTIVSPTAVTTRVRGLSTAGDYSFKLTVQNGLGTSALDTVVIHVAASATATYDPTDTTQIVVKTGATATTPALFHLPGDYATSGKSYPLLIFCPGSGITSASALYNDSTNGGPTYYIGHGRWPSAYSNPVDGQSYKFIVASPWYTLAAGPNTTGAVTAAMVDTIIKDIKTRYRIDSNRIYLTGIGAGGQAVVTYISNAKDADGTPIHVRSKIAASVPMTAQFNGSHEKLIADSVFAAKAGIWCIGDPTESWGANTLDINYYINQDSAGYGQSSTFSGGRCCWSQFYTPAYSKAWRGNNVSIYQFLLGYKANYPVPTPVTASAGPDQNLVRPLDSALLNGSGSTGGVTSYSWSFISGPSSPTLVTPSAVSTRVRGLSVVGTYSFKLTVSNSSGSVASDTVLIGVTSSCGGIRRSLAIGANDAGKYITPSNTTANPGDTLVVSSAHRWSYLSGDGLHGTASCPIVIMNDTGQVEMTAGIAFSNSTYMHVTGTGSANHFYGFYIHSYDSVSPVSRGNSLQFSDRSAFCEIDHIDEYLRTYCMWLKEEASCPDSLRWPNWRLDNFSIHDIRAKNINQDGFYLGSTSPNGERAITCNGVNVSPIPLRLSNIHIYNIILDSVGRTGIQLSGADSGNNEINNCHITGTGFEFNPQQGSGIILGGYTQASIHDNYIRNTFQHGIFCIGAGLQNVYNNDIDSSGYLRRTAGDTLTKNPGYSNISADTRLTTNQGATPNGIKSTIYVKNNKVGLSSNQDPNTLIVYNIDIGLGYTSYPTWNTGNVVCNNFFQNGTTPAIVRVNPNISYTSSCTGGSGYSVITPTTVASVSTLGGSAVALTNYPNPFTESTTISFMLSRPSSVLLKVNNVMGATLAVLARGHMEAGMHNYSKEFDSKRLAAGVYILQLIVNGQPYTRMMIKQ